MSEANKEEVERCKKIAMAAMSNGDTEKAMRFLEKAKRMSPGDGSIDGLIHQVKNGPASGAGSAAPPPQNASEGPRLRRAQTEPAVSSSGNRVNKDGKEYTPEQQKMVQSILRQKDYYAILNLDKDAKEEDVKKAYKKMALKLHPDKCAAPGAEEAFKKVSKAVQCLTDSEKKRIYDHYGDEDRIPQHHRQNFHQGDFMTPEDLFSAFFGGGAFQTHHHHHQRQQQHREQDPEAAQRAQIFQMLPVILLVVMTLASSISGRDGSGRFSFQPQGQYQFERTTRTLGTQYYVTQDFEEHYQEGTKAMAEFERQVEVYYVRQKHSDCDYQEQVMYKKVMLAKRRGNEDDVRQARNHPRPACKELERVKRNHQNIYRQALYASFHSY